MIWRTFGALTVLAAACGEPAAPASSATTTSPARDAAPSVAGRSSEPVAKAEAGQGAGKMRDAMKSMAGQPAEQRQAFAGAAIAESTKGTIPESLREAFDKLQTLPPDMRRLALMKGLATPEAALVWSQVCPAGPQALADMAKLAPAEHGKYLVATCKLSGDGLITSAEAEKTDGLALAAALTAARPLGKSEVERELLAFFLKASPSR